MSVRKLNTGQKECALDVTSIQDTSTLAHESRLGSIARPFNESTGKYTTAGLGLQEVQADLNSEWRQRKFYSLFLSDVYLALASLSSSSFPSGSTLSDVVLPNGVRPGLRGLRVRDCSTYLEFSGPARDSLHLTRANFCRDRLCPQCNKRRSLKIFAQTSAVMDYLQEHFPGYQYIFLTMTVKNCSSDELSATIDLLQSGWRHFYHESGYFRKKHVYDPEPVFMGSFRALEVKRADDGVNWHPHLHVIVAVPSSYFRSDRYMHTRDLVKLWRRACRLDYDPLCYIKACTPSVDPDGSTVSYRDAVAELSKYAAKSKDYLNRADLDFSVAAVYTLLMSLHKRRLCSYTGCFLKARQALALDDPFDGDLVNVDPTQLRPDVSDLVFRFGWQCGVYVLLDDPVSGFKPKDGEGVSK